MKNRIYSIDLLRGIIMVVMALDHTRDYFHESALIVDPTDLTKTTAAVFMTRWITHFCAPAFVLLSGLSISMNLASKGKSEMTKYLITRGLWLVLLDVIVLRFGFFFNFYYDITFFSILWLIGWCMVLMAGVLYLPKSWIPFVAVVIVFGHDALGGITFGEGSLLTPVWTILMSVGFVPPAFVSTYAVIPWLGIMILGYSLGSIYSEKFEGSERRRLLVLLGALSLALFLLIRWSNWYGDSNPWKEFQDPLLTTLSFINVTKYPVSLLFTLMTVGTLLLALSALDQVRGRWTQLLTVYGRVPLFYFLVHFYLIHAAALVVSMVMTGRSVSQLDLHFDAGFGGIVRGTGLSLGWVYIVWILVVLALYPLCRWYDEYKHTHRREATGSKWWLSYV